MGSSKWLLSCSLTCTFMRHQCALELSSLSRYIRVLCLLHIYWRFPLIFVLFGLRRSGLGSRVMFVPKRVPQDADVLGSDDDVRCL